jgi:hypothetical protein
MFQCGRHSETGLLTLMIYISVNRLHSHAKYLLFNIFASDPIIEMVRVNQFLLNGLSFCL